MPQFCLRFAPKHPLSVGFLVVHLLDQHFSGNQRHDKIPQLTDFFDPQPLHPL